jgi:hypothetical protein
MSSSGDGFVALILIAAAGAAAAGYLGAFGQTGPDYFESCWTLKAETIKEGFAGKPKPKSPQQAISWAACEPTTLRSVYEAGIIFVGDPKDADEATLEKVCPSSYRQIPIGGAYMLTVELLEAAGGPNFTDRFLPAGVMVGRVWSKKWPRCSSERERQGYPKIVEKSPSSFGWERPCPKCK